MSRPADLTSKAQSFGRCCDGRVLLERLPDTRNISARVYIQGKLVRKSTRTANVREARKLATQWWQELCVRDRRGERLHVATFADISVKYLARRKQDADAKTLSSGQYRNLVQKDALLAPLIGSRLITEVDDQFLLRLRERREQATNKKGDLITQSTIKKDFIFIHSVLVFARDTLRVIAVVPANPPFRGEKAIVRQGRPFLTQDEYKTLTTLAKTQAGEPDQNVRSQRQRLSLYRFILLSVGGALRVSEAESVRWCDCEETTVLTPQETEKAAVLMYVLGKRSRGGSRSAAHVMFDGYRAYEEMKSEREVLVDHADDTALLFPESHREGMKRLLKDAGLYEYRDPKTGKMRTRDRKSLRPTAITMRLDREDNISYRAIAEWARTSSAMVEDYYDQLHPAQAAGEVATFRKKTSVSPAR